MPGIRVHLLIGALFYPVFYILYFLLSKMEPISTFGINTVIMSYILFVLGSDLPDIDADFAPVRYFTHSMLPLVFIYSFYNSKPINAFFKRFGILSWPLLITSSVLFGLMTGYFLKLLKHRGFLHTIRFAFIYGIVIFLVAKYGMDLKDKASLFLSFSGFFGIIVHLILDKEVKF